MPSTTPQPINEPAGDSRAEPASAARPSVVYVSYDGVGEPLGRSQVLEYLTRLTRAYEITLISYEKSAEAISEMRHTVARSGINWLPLRYHHWPPVLSTLLDVLAGRRALIRAARGRAVKIVHVRSDVPALIAVLARHKTHGKLLFDIRGFWADERVEGGLWPAGGVLYRVAKRCERRFYAEADAVVTLTAASVGDIRGRLGHATTTVDVIPTCVDLSRFSERPQRPDGPHAVWTGSIGTWYRFDLVRAMATALSLPLTVITRQTDLARRLLGDFPATVRSATPDEMPSQLFAGDVGLCLITSTYSKMASAPTRFAEYLAVGMPVLVTAGVGDLETIVQEHAVGVVLRGEDEAAMARAAREVRAMAEDRQVRERCRRVAREMFDVEVGTARYGAIYHRLLSPEIGRPPD